MLGTALVLVLAAATPLTLRVDYVHTGGPAGERTFDNKRMREAAAAAPYDFVESVVNDRKYGGGGIQNLYATVSADNAFTPYVFVHEFDAHAVGAFEGAMYEAKGYYRPQADCIMFTRDDVGFCAVCRRAIERVIDLYAVPKGGAARR